jgi:hypothetical protein
VPVPSSTNESAESDATTSGVVVAEFEVAAVEVPIAFVAVTANVYAMPGCRPSKVKVPPVACVSVFVMPSGVDVAVYEVTTEPLFESGAPKLTVALRLPVAVARTLVGAEGAPTVVIELEALDAEPVPAELVALTVKV